MPKPIRRTPSRKPATPLNLHLPRRHELERLSALCALARAHERARRTGALSLIVGRPRNPKPARPETRDETMRKAEQRIELMIELEVRWRMEQLGVAYTEKVGERFAHFRFDSDHRRKLEQLNRLAADVRFQTQAKRAGTASEPK